MIVARLVGIPRTERAANARLIPIAAVGSAVLNTTTNVTMLLPVICDLWALRPSSTVSERLHVESSDK